MEEKEIWKDIKGYEGMYQVSNMNNVKSLNYNGTGKEKLLKPLNNGHGYLRVNLWKDGKIKQCLVHRLVADAFIQFVPQEGVMYDVDHRNTDRTDNRAINLCWVSRSQNMNNPITNSKLSKPVLGINKINGLILEFPSAHEASRVLRIDQGSITRCCQGKQKAAKGYTFFYANANDADAE